LRSIPPENANPSVVQQQKKEDSENQEEEKKEEVTDIEYHQDFLTLSKPKIEVVHALM
jgi:hypothetical protein